MQKLSKKRKYLFHQKYKCWSSEVLGEEKIKLHQRECRLQHLSLSTYFVAKSTWNLRLCSPWQVSSSIFATTVIVSVLRLQRVTVQSLSYQKRKILTKVWIVCISKNPFFDESIARFCFQVVLSRKSALIDFCYFNISFFSPLASLPGASWRYIQSGGKWSLLRIIERKVLLSCRKSNGLLGQKKDLDHASQIIQPFRYAKFRGSFSGAFKRWSFRGNKWDSIWPTKTDVASLYRSNGKETRRNWTLSRPTCNKSLDDLNRSNWMLWSSMSASSLLFWRTTCFYVSFVQSAMSSCNGNLFKKSWATNSKKWNVKKSRYLVPVNFKEKIYTLKFTP